MGEYNCKYDIESFAKELGVDLENISGLFFSYVEEMKGEIDSMTEFLNKNDWYMLQRVVHNIKGVSANLGIGDVFAEAEKFDILLKEGKTEDSEIHVKNLINTIDNAEKEILKFFQQLGISL